MKMNSKISIIIIALISITFLSLLPFALAQEEEYAGSDMKYIGAGIAFAGAAIGAGYGIGQAGSAGLAAAAEKESMKTQGLIITALAEAVAIYGIVVALLILGS